jgi:hypothetical protein
MCTECVKGDCRKGDGNGEEKVFHALYSSIWCRRINEDGPEDWERVSHPQTPVYVSDSSLYAS